MRWSNQFGGNWPSHPGASVARLTRTFAIDRTTCPDETRAIAPPRRPRPCEDRPSSSTGMILQRPRVLVRNRCWDHARTCLRCVQDPGNEITRREHVPYHSACRRHAHDERGPCSARTDSSGPSPIRISPMTSRRSWTQSALRRPTFSDTPWVQERAFSSRSVTRRRWIGWSQPRSRTTRTGGSRSSTHSSPT